MTKYNDPLAYHEAGHVVVMHAMGYESPGVSVLGSEEEGPYARSGIAAGDPAVDLVVTLAAGAAAEDLYHEIQGTGMRFYTSGICLTDFTRIADLIGEDASGVDAPEQLLDEEWWMDCVDLALLSMLRANWTAVNALAEALLKHGALDRADNGGDPRSWSADFALCQH
jgi:hypothetical protein